LVGLLSDTNIVLRFQPLRPLEAVEALNIVSICNEASFDFGA